MFTQLCENISEFPRQRALRQLVTDQDDAEYAFNVSNNEGASSSILDLGRHAEIWPDVFFQSKILLRSITLDTLLEREGISNNYDVLVMDTQGSELLILKGAIKLLSKVKYVKTEAADFEAYIGCARVDELIKFSARFGFKMIQKHEFARSSRGGKYFDLLFCTDEERSVFLQLTKTWHNAALKAEAGLGVLEHAQLMLKRIRYWRISWQGSPRN